MVVSLRSFAFRALVVALAAAAWVAVPWAQARWAYIYALSNFGGRLPYDFVRVVADLERDEVYMVYQNLIRIFSPSGMEVFSFGDGLDLGQIVDVAVDERGDIILLSYRNGQPVLTRCNFRGDPVGTIEVTGLPEGLTFGGNRMVHRGGLLYFATLGAARVIVTTTTGEYRRHVDLVPLLELDDKHQGGVELSGFNVDAEGNILFTVSELFRGFRLSPDGKLASFGKSGSAPGLFGVVAGIATDSQGNVLVTDRLKCVVIAFSKDFQFLTELGYRGARPENLIVPDDIAVDRQDRLYVSQGRRRGVSVFAPAK